MHGAYDVRVFGSVAHGDAGPDSDIDVLVNVGTDYSPWFPSGLLADVQDLLGRPVDIVTENGLHSYIRERVIREALPLRLRMNDTVYLIHLRECIERDSPPLRRAVHAMLAGTGLSMRPVSRCAASCRFGFLAQHWLCQA